jgi:hypothetical protein
MYATRAITRTLQLQRGAFTSRALLRQSQSRGFAVAAKNTDNISDLKSSSPHNNDEAPPDFVRLGIQRMLEQAQRQDSNHMSTTYNGCSTSVEQNSKALQALEHVQVRTITLAI